MKRTFKILLRIFLIGLILVIGAISFFVWKLETSIDKILTEEQKESLFKEIESSPELPESFYTTIEKYFKDDFKFDQGAWGSITQNIFGGRRDQCPCREIYFPPFHIKDGAWINRFYSEIIALELEENFSNKKCLEYELSTWRYPGCPSYLCEGVQEASRFYYDKEIEELNEREIVEILLMFKCNYRKTDQEKLDNEVERRMNAH